MPPEAKVAIIEDSALQRLFVSSIMKKHDHVVVAEASTFDEAKDLIPELSEKGVEVVLLDGNLSEDRIDGFEGRTLAREIKIVNPDIKIIGVTADPKGFEGALIDGVVDKGQLVVGKVNLGEMVTAI
jgi:DNA-binding NarL/FixJ family response regulator